MDERVNIMLLNRCLTVGVGRSNSHQGKGWEEVTEAAIRALNARVDGNGKPKPWWLFCGDATRRVWNRCSPTPLLLSHLIRARFPHPEVSSAPNLSLELIRPLSTWVPSPWIGVCNPSAVSVSR